MIPMMISNMAAGLISMEFGFAGPNFCVVTACATSNTCIGEAWRLIRDDEADVIVAGGSEAACVPLGMSGFAALRALSTRNDEPEKASRPFDKDRDGFVLGEGAGTVILEELEHAKKRGANILAELTGYGLTADAYHMTSPPPGGGGAEQGDAVDDEAGRRGTRGARLITSMRTELPTPVGDVAETECDQGGLRRSREEAVGELDQVDDRAILLGAAGAVELIFCVKAIEKNILPPTRSTSIIPIRPATSITFRTRLASGRSTSQ